MNICGFQIEQPNASQVFHWRNGHPLDTLNKYKFDIKCHDL